MAEFPKSLGWSRPLAGPLDVIVDAGRDLVLRTSGGSLHIVCVDARRAPWLPDVLRGCTSGGVAMSGRAIWRPTPGERWRGVDLVVAGAAATPLRFVLRFPLSSHRQTLERLAARVCLTDDLGFVELERQLRLRRALALPPAPTVALQDALASAPAG